MDAISLAARLIQQPSLSGQEGPVADIVEEVMHHLGYRDVFRDSFGSVIGIAGPDRGRPRVLFDGHMDVAAVCGTWRTDPFGGEVISGRLYGRGSTDMKAALSAAICGVGSAALSGHLAAPVAVSATVLEETIEGIALQQVLDRLRPECVVICEPTDLKIAIGQRGRIEILLTVRGIPAHAAHPECGINAVDLAARALTALAEMEVQSDPDLGDAILVPTDIVSEPYPSISLLPHAVRIRFDRRTLVGEQPEHVLAAILQQLSTVDPEAFSVQIAAAEVRTYTGITVNPIRFLPAWRVPAEDPLVCAAKSAVGSIGAEPRLGFYAVCTNGSASAGERSIPTIGLGPGRESDAHIVDESVSIQAVKDVSRIYRRIALELAVDSISTESSPSGAGSGQGSHL